MVSFRHRLRDRLPTSADVEAFFAFTPPGWILMFAVGGVLTYVTWPFAPVLVGIAVGLDLYEVRRGR